MGRRCDLHPDLGRLSVFGNRPAQAIAQSTPGTLEAREALELIQMDHTLADVIIVDSRHRRPIGRGVAFALFTGYRCYCDEIPRAHLGHDIGCLR